MLILPVALAATGASAVVNFWLSWRVAQVRSDAKIWVGDGGEPRLVARMRAHANFAEYAPIVLILIALIELAGGSQLWLWGVAAAFIVARICHGFGMDGWKPGRMIGASVTAVTMIGLGIYAAILPALTGHLPF